MKLLMLEDDPLLRGALEKGLREAGYVLDSAADGASGWHLLRTGDYDGAVLDWMLPDVSGLEVLKRHRRAGGKTPVLMLTARDATADLVNGLDAGADDYLVKPFEFVELLARIRVMLRHRYAQSTSIIRIEDLEIDLGRREARRGGSQINLTPREFSLLELLGLRANRVVSRLEIWNRLYESDSDGTSNVVDVYVSYLRRKIDAGRKRLIVTRRGEGYMLRGDPCDPPSAGDS